jgi:hypothetical protein
MVSYLEHSLDVAFQLVEVRTGPFGLKPIRARDGFAPTGTLERFRAEIDKVVTHMKGEVGSRKKANAQKAQAALSLAWANGGSARTAFEAMVTRYNL